MGMTITEKILARAGGLPTVSPGDVAVVDVETACLIDLSFLPEGWRRVLKVADPSQGGDRVRPPGARADRAGRSMHADRARVRAASSASSGCTMSAPTRASATRSSPTRPTRCPAPCW